ncbi:uncharacterized protein LOC118463525 [Anopheles albimanus]|uniref:uncharacterized protein LOC118463525 n=1 Tax=Anopheles albimanus TaxID=7167 RepID=UPI001640F203|nr:uncharacterized protein LOC118463525 [Anopheles albimanus]
MKESLSLHDRKKIAGNGLRPVDEEEKAAMSDKKLISITTSAPNSHSVAKNPLQPIENTATNMEPVPVAVAAGLPPPPPASAAAAAATNTSEGKQTFPSHGARLTGNR